MVVNSGKGASRPVNRGPRDGASAVMRTTKAVAITMRNGMSQRGGSASVTSFGSAWRGKALSTRIKTRNTIAHNGTTGSVTCSSTTVQITNPTTAAPSAYGHFERQASCEYAAMNAACEIPPASVPAAELAAKAGPWLNARKNVIGPVVSGKAISQPLMEWPHRRPARLAVPIIAGVTRTFRSKLFIDKVRQCSAYLSTVPGSTLDLSGGSTQRDLHQARLRDPDVILALHEDGAVEPARIEDNLVILLDGRIRQND